MVSTIPEINWITRYFSFISNAFFQLGLSVANLFMNWGSKRCLIHNKHYHTETGFIIMSVSMSRPKSIYVYICDLFFFFIFIFIMINRAISWIQTHFFFCLCSRVCHIIFGWYWEWKTWFLNSQSSVSRCCSAFAWFFANFSLALLIKVLLVKKRVV